MSALLWLLLLPLAVFGVALFLALLALDRSRWK